MNNVLFCVKTQCRNKKLSVLFLGEVHNYLLVIDAGSKRQALPPGLAATPHPPPIRTCQRVLLAAFSDLFMAADNPSVDTYRAMVYAQTDDRIKRLNEQFG